MTKSTILALAALIVLSGCSSADPSAVCGATSVKRDVVAMLVGNISSKYRGQELEIADRLAERLNFSEIAFDGQDEQTGRISCSASVGPADGAAPSERVIYSRQKEVGGEQYLYTVQVPYQSANGGRMSETLIQGWLRNYADEALKGASAPVRTSSSSAATQQTPPPPTRLSPDQTARMNRFGEDAVTTANEREKRLAAANGEAVEDAYRYQVADRDTRITDLDGDGDQDIIFLVQLCEETNCHATTQSTVVALMRNDGGTITEGVRRVFEGPGKIVTVSADGAVIQTMEFGPDDPSCCASLERTHRMRMP